MLMDLNSHSSVVVSWAGTYLHLRGDLVFRLYVCAYNLSNWDPGNRDD